MEKLCRRRGGRAIGVGQRMAELQGQQSPGLRAMAPLPGRRGGLTLPGRRARAELWQRMDVDGTGVLSLALIDRTIVAVFPDLNHKPSLMRAYHAADSSRSGLVTRDSFSQLLQYIVYFNNLWHRFEALDSDSEGELDVGEFFDACMTVGLHLTAHEVESEFARIGQGRPRVPFGEFCTWCARRHVGDAAAFPPPPAPPELTAATATPLRPQRAISPPSAGRAGSPEHDTATILRLVTEQETVIASLRDRIRKQGGQLDAAARASLEMASDRIRALTTGLEQHYVVAAAAAPPPPPSTATPTSIAQGVGKSSSYSPSSPTATVQSRLGATVLVRGANAAATGRQTDPSARSTTGGRRRRAQARRLESPPPPTAGGGRVAAAAGGARKGQLGQLGSPPRARGRARRLGSPEEGRGRARTSPPQQRGKASLRLDAQGVLRRVPTAGPSMNPAMSTPHVLDATAGAKVGVNMEYLERLHKLHQERERNLAQVRALEAEQMMRLSSPVRRRANREAMERLHNGGYVYRKNQRQVEMHRPQRQPAHGAAARAQRSQRLASPAARPPAPAATAAAQQRLGSPARRLHSPEQRARRLASPASVRTAERLLEWAQERDARLAAARAQTERRQGQEEARARTARPTIGKRSQRLAGKRSIDKMLEWQAARDLRMERARAAKSAQESRNNHSQAAYARLTSPLRTPGPQTTAALPRSSTRKAVSKSARRRRPRMEPPQPEQVGPQSYACSVHMVGSVRAVAGWLTYRCLGGDSRGCPRCGGGTQIHALHESGHGCAFQRQLRWCACAF
jgi:Ca2+-binding EF-hand superfamily protein